MNQSQMETVHGVDIYDIYELSYISWWENVWFLSLIVLIIIGFIGAFIFYKRYKNKHVISYEEKIQKQLLSLKKLAPEDASQFYSILTNIAKEYISQMYGISVQGLTDHEVIQLLKTSATLPKVIIDELMKIFEGITIIKFARASALKEMMDQALESMNFIIEQTKKIKQKKRK